MVNMLKEQWLICITCSYIEQLVGSTKIEDAGADSVAIKDMAGLLKPNAAFELYQN